MASKSDASWQSSFVEADKQSSVQYLVCELFGNEHAALFGNRRRQFVGQAATSSRLLFVGHFHRWVAASVNAILPWHGSEPLYFEPGMRYLVSIGAACHGASAILDLSESTLYPFNDP